MIWALASLTAFAAGLCLWAALTGRPAGRPRHAAYGETRPLENWWADDDHLQVIHGPTKRWYDENPWPADQPQGWGPVRD